MAGHEPGSQRPVLCRPSELHASRVTGPEESRMLAAHEPGAQHPALRRFSELSASFVSGETTRPE